MKTKSKRKFIPMTSPLGTAAWAKLYEPDQFGNYSITLRAPDSALEPLRQRMQAALDESLPIISEDAVGPVEVEQNPFPIRQVLDDEGKPTGTSELRVKQAAVVKIPGRDKPLLPKVVVIDCANPPNRLTCRVGNGSQVMIGMDVGSYARPSTERKDAKGRTITLVGITARLSVVRVVSLVQEGENDPSRYAFGAVEDGYVYEDNTETAEPAESGEGATNETAGADY